MLTHGDVNAYFSFSHLVLPCEMEMCSSGNIKLHGKQLYMQFFFIAGNDGVERTIVHKRGGGEEWALNVS